ncbi:MAG: VOC family protein [Candidatus Eremiobacteraeota bacterium]|nr:VOC family protein [Candidatus Eremiobacteraeota bacterium]
MIKDIAFVAYPADDAGSLTAFYRDTLGLSLGNTFEEEGQVQYAEFGVGSGYFGIMNRQWMDVPKGSASGIAFESDDIEKTRKDLMGKGVKVDDIYDTPVCRVCSFRDPEGNKVTLHQSTIKH